MFKRIALAVIASGLLGLGGCGGGGSDSFPISVTFSTSPPSSIATNATASIAALVSNDPNDAGVSWSATCSGGSCGSFNPTTTGNAVATTYMAPSTIPNPATVTITATSVTDHTKTVSATVTITGTTAPVLADGTYVYHLSGNDSAGPYTVAGAFTVAAGVITGGEQDFTDPQGGYTDSLVPATSTLNTAGRNLQIVLDTGNNAIGVNGVETLRGAVVSATRVLISEFDLSAAGTGSLDLKTGNATPSGGYAFAVSGNDTAGNPLAIGGVLAFNAGTLDTTRSVFDLSDFGTQATVLLKQAFQSGSVTAPDSFGRVVLTLVPSSASQIAQMQLTAYVLGTNRMEIVESAEPNDTLNANTGGSALGQGSNTGTFTATSASVLNQSYAHGSGGVDVNGATTMAGGFSLSQNGVLGGVLAVNDVNFIGAWTVGGTYTVDPTGRVTVNVTSLTSQATPPANSMQFELYLDGNGNAMIMGADSFQTTQGIAFEQGTGFSLAGGYALSGQGVVATTSGGVPWSAVGPVTVTNGSFSGSTDLTANSTNNAVALSGTQNSAQGTFSLAGLNATNFNMSTGYGYYPLSGNRLWAIEIDNQGISILLMEGVAP